MAHHTNYPDVRLGGAKPYLQLPSRTYHEGADETAGHAAAWRLPVQGLCTVSSGSASSSLGTRRLGILVCHHPSASSAVQEPTSLQPSSSRAMSSARAGRFAGSFARHARITRSSDAGTVSSLLWEGGSG